MPLQLNDTSNYYYRTYCGLNLFGGVSQERLAVKLADWKHPSCTKHGINRGFKRLGMFPTSSIFKFDFLDFKVQIFLPGFMPPTSKDSYGSLSGFLSKATHGSHGKTFHFHATVFGFFTNTSAGFILAYERFGGGQFEPGGCAVGTTTAFPGASAFLLLLASVLPRFVRQLHLRVLVIDRYRAFVISVAWELRPQTLEPLVLPHCASLTMGCCAPVT